MLLFVAQENYAQRTNRNYTASATMSSVRGTNSAAHAVDGSHTNGLKARSYVDRHAWIKLDLGQPEYVENIKLFAPITTRNAYLVTSLSPINLLQEGKGIKPSDLQNILQSPWCNYYHITALPGNGQEIPIQGYFQYAALIYTGNTGYVYLNEFMLVKPPYNTPPFMEEICGDGIDNDGNGLIDCEDYPCGVGTLSVEITQPSCGICTDGEICVTAENDAMVTIDEGNNYTNITGGVAFCFSDLSEGDYTVKARTLDGCVKVYTDDEGMTAITLESPNGQFPPLSDLGEDVLDAITDDAVQEFSTVGEGLEWTGGNLLEAVLVDGPEIFGTARDILSEAEHEVDIAFYKFTTCEASDLIGQGLRDTEGTLDEPLLVRFLVDDQNNLSNGGSSVWHVVNSWGLDLQFFEIQIVTAEHFIVGTYHDKIIVVDGHTVLLTGANPESAHNAGDPWRDTGYLIRGKAGEAALFNIDQAIDEIGTHWECEGNGCDERDPFPLPDRSWLDDNPVFGGSNILAAGRRRNTSIGNNNIDNPQDQAWLALLGNATDHVNIATPNINDDAFQDAVIDACSRGVTVNLLTSRLFNAATENIPGQGGYNREVISDLRKRMRNDHPAQIEFLQVRWFSQDGVSQIIGNGGGAQHTKFMTVDNSIAMVGTGNHDTQSWNNSHEFNFVIDNPGDVDMMHDAFFTGDWENGNNGYIEFYEANNIDQDIVAIESTEFNHTSDYKNDPTYLSVNDEARSAIIYDTPANTVIKIYDSPSGSTSDDWLEIIVLQDIDRLEIPTFEESFINDDIAVVYHAHNGLDGKVSSVEIGTHVPKPKVDLYEDTNTTGDLVCSIDVPNSLFINFKNTGQCDNDEAKSAKLINLSAGQVITVYDNPSGSQSDDYTTIHVLKNVFIKLIPSFEESWEDEDVRVTFHENNGLNGKVSSFRSQY